MDHHDEFCRCTDKQWSNPEWCTCAAIAIIRRDERDIIRVGVEELSTVKVDDYLYLGMIWYADVMALLDDQK